jgi:hypothetical protein
LGLYVTADRAHRTGDSGTGKELIKSEQFGHEMLAICFDPVST